MSEEEKKAIEWLEDISNFSTYDLVYVEKVLRLLKQKNDRLEQLEKENEKKSKRLDKQFKLLEKRDKEIEELKADNKHQWEERCKLTFEFELLEKEKDYYFKQYQYHLKQNESLTREFSNSIPKSVIREKIKELELETISSKDYNKIGDYLVDTIKTLALKELLE